MFSFAGALLTMDVVVVETECGIHAAGITAVMLQAVRMNEAGYISTINTGRK